LKDKVFRGLEMNTNKQYEQMKFWIRTE